MAIQTTPHTQTQQNVNDAQPDLEPNQLAQNTAQNEDTDVYENSAGPQTGSTRAFHANEERSNLPNVLPETAAMTGRTNTRTPQSEDQGITNHSASEESARQKKVVSERPDAQAGVNQAGKSGH